MSKPYARVPSHADVEYVDGKLRVAAGIIHRAAERGERKEGWLKTVDELLDRRLELMGA
ncbi:MULTISPECIES: hypothetical protein [unclassified Nocardioides]|uniref:hypothetical protein n=1 Tax=unclassified Nocardioides TaxID=2615069 RepID=UPI0009F092B2|nr:MULTISPECIES: hypothetical protein [unclassified Nocardioides]GAW50604.1 Virulence plasmid 28 protein (Precursor) [Nocardioides sp. PD653-B2]GAW57582.1 Virulence plasmid 28 protein (Precursor) [Nocardioides sp. PD653]